MAGDFDPYYTWLAIPPEEQPPDHYRLLAVRKYEANTDVISNAADQRMTHLRSFQNGKHAGLSQQLLNEVSAARLTLLVVERKQTYDQQLRAQEAALAPPALAPLAPLEEPASWLDAPPGPPASSATSPLMVVTKPLAQPASAYEPEIVQPLTQNPLLWIGLGVVAVCFFGGIAAVAGLVLWSRSPASVAVKPAPVVPVTQPPVDPSPQPVEPLVETVAPPPPPPPPPGAPPGIGRSDGATAHPSEAKRAARLTLNNYVELSNTADVAGAGQEFTAEAWVRWQADDSKPQAILGNEPHTRGGAAGDGASSWLLSIAARGRAVLQWGEGGTQNADCQFPADAQWHHVAVCGSADSLAVYCDGVRRMETKFAGAPSAARGTNFYLGAPSSTADKPLSYRDFAAFRLTKRVRYRENFSPPLNFANDVGTLALLDFNSARGDRVQDLSRQGRDGKMANSEWVQLVLSSAREVAIGKATSPSVPLNLIDHLNMKQPKAGRSKLLEHLAVTTDRSTPVVIPIQVEVPQSYLLEATVTRKEGSDMFGLGLLVGGQQTMFEFDAFGSTASGIDMIGGDRVPAPSYPGAYKGTLLPIGQAKKLAVFVYPRRVTVTVKDEKIFEWEGDARQLGMVGNFQPVGPPGLFLASWDSSFEVRDLRLRPLQASYPGVVAVKPPARATEPFADQPKYVAPQVGAGDITAEAAPVESALPSSEALKVALAQLHATMTTEFATAKAPSDKEMLATRLLNLVRFARDEPVKQFVLYSEAIRLACEAGNATQAMGLIEQQSQQFPIDMEETKVDALKLCGANARKSSEMKYLSRSALEAADDAIEQEKFSTAESLLNMAISAATKANDPALRAKVVERNKEMKELQKAAKFALQAQERLKTDPTNAKANLAYGRYLCFVRGDHAASWPYLAKGDHAQLAALAKVEQAIASNDVGQHLDLADQWWGLAQTSSGNDKEDFLVRAYHWYRTARLRASGISKTKAEKRCDDIQQVVAAEKLNPPSPQPIRPVKPIAKTTRLRPGPLGQPQYNPIINLLTMVDPKRDAVRGEWSVVNGELRCASMHQVPKLILPYLPPEEYDIKVTFSQPTLRNDVSIILPRLDKSFAWMLGGTQGIFRFSHHPATLTNGVEPTKSLHPGAFVPDQKYTTIVQVRKRFVKAYFQGRLAAEHQTDYQDLQVDVWRTLPNPRFMAVGCDDPTTFHEIELIEVTGRGQPLQQRPN